MVLEYGQEIGLAGRFSAAELQPWRTVGFLEVVFALEIANYLVLEVES